MQIKHLSLAAVLSVLAAMLLLVPAVLQAQWIPPKGEGSLSFEYQRFGMSRNIMPDIQYVRWPDDFDRNEADTIVEGNILVMSVDYGLHERLGLNVTVPFVHSEFIDSPFIYTSGANADDEPNKDFQDLGVTFTHLTLTDPVLVTTSLGATWPLTDYDTHGHAAVGRKLKNLRAGVGVARRLNPLLGDFMIQANYTFSYSERLSDFRPNRSTGFVSLTYFPPMPSLTLSAFYNHEITHDGLAWGALEWNTNFDEYWHIHDRVVDERFAQLGGVVSYAVNHQLGVYLGAFTTIDALSAYTQNVGGFTLGTTTNF